MDEKVKEKKKAKTKLKKAINIVGKEIIDATRNSNKEAKEFLCEIEPKVTIRLCDISSADVETRSNPVSLIGKQIYKVRLEVYGKSAEHILNQMERYYQYINKKEQEHRVKIKP
jgi:hypothetical protein